MKDRRSWDKEEWIVLGKVTFLWAQWGSIK